MNILYHESPKMSEAFSVMHLHLGFSHIEVDETNRWKSAFITPDELYECNSVVIV